MTLPGPLLLLGALTLTPNPTPADAPGSASDPRDIRLGRVIPDEGYCDQPYVVRTDDGRWLCVMTTGPGVEGQPGQHVVSTTSADQGRTWTPLVPVEPAGGPEASWAMPLKTPGGRVYVFYSYNAANLRAVPGSNDANLAKRVDTLGDYAFKYSDDHGRTWSKGRWTIPVREFAIDRGNHAGGRVRFFWGVGKPVVAGDAAVFGFAKVGKWGAPGGMVTSQGAFLRSDNILNERDPAKIVWETLPAGDEGLRAPKGPVADEANLVVLSDGSFYATYRTIDGYPCAATSRDGGRTWTPPAYAVYRPGGRRIKHPRAANFVRKFANGKYLYWFHNHGGEPVHAAKWAYYTGRNPAWVSGGVERGGTIHWSEPEVLLYDEDPDVRVSYPDFIEDGGRVFVTETQKTVARVHEIERGLLDAVWTQHDRNEVARDGLVLELQGSPVRPGTRVTLPRLPDPATRRGFTIDLRLKAHELTAGQTLLDTRDGSGRGLTLATTARSTLALSLSDGRTTATWDSDPGTHEGTLRTGVWQHVTVIVDAGPRLILFVVDGVLNDGGTVRDYGYGRFDPELGDVNGTPEAAVAPSWLGELTTLRVYDRALRVSEAVSNHRAGDPKP